MVRESLSTLYQKGCEALKEIEPNCYSFEILQMLRAITGIDPRIKRNDNSFTLSEEECKKFHQMLTRRLAREPLQYILEEWEFFSLPFSVGKGVLIPRPDTEIVVETAIQLLQQKQYPLYGADLCSGSGAIAIAMAKNLPHVQITALELSPEAMIYLEKNVAQNACQDQVEVVQGDITQWKPQRPLDFIVSNPPYIPTGDIPELDPEVLQEPNIALDGGVDGMHFYQQIAKRFYPMIADGGVIIFEIGIHQSQCVAEILEKHHYRDIAFTQDLLGIPRCIYGFK